MNPSQQSITTESDQSSKVGLTESMASDMTATMSVLDVTGLTLSRPGTPMGSSCGTSTMTMMHNQLQSNKNKNEVVINHKTKVSQVKPLRRIAYEWEWDIIKFDKAFPPPPLNLSSSHGGKIKILKSDKISAGSEIGRKSDWKFVLSENSGRLNWHIVLGRVHRGLPTINAAVTLRIMDGNNGQEVLHKARCFYDFGERFKFGWNDIIRLDALYADKHIFLVDNTLKIRVLFEMFADTTARDIEGVQQIRDDFAKIVTYDLNRLRTATGTADVHLECDGKVFPVHKLILSARSTAFAGMFEATLPKPASGGSTNKWIQTTASGDRDSPDSSSEHKIAVVSIPHIDSAILEIILDYIYSGNVKIAVTVDQTTTTIPQTICGVIQAADKFELRELKAHCFNVLMNYLNDDNIGQICVLAHRHQADKNIRMNINGFCLRNLTTLMKTRAFRDALKLEPDAFFADDDCL